MIGPPECCIISGYDEEGKALLGWNYFQEDEKGRDLTIEPSGYFRKRNWFRNTKGLLLIGERRQRPDLEEQYIESLRWALQVMETPVVRGYASGHAAYLAWADALSDEKDFHDLPLEVLRERHGAHNLAA